MRTSVNNTVDLMIEADLSSWQISSLSHGTLLNARLSEQDKQVFKAVFERDDYTCYYCGFRAKEHQEIHHLNHDHKDLRADNLVTACTLCHRSFHPNILNLNNAATMIWLPEMTQQALNRILRVIFVAQYYSSRADCRHNMIAQTAYSYLYENILKNRAAPIAKVIPNREMNDLATVAQILLDIQKESAEQQSAQYKNRHAWLKYIKLLHHPETLEAQIKYWAEQVYFENAQAEFNDWLALVS